MFSLRRSSTYTRAHTYLHEGQVDLEWTFLGTVLNLHVSFTTKNKRNIGKNGRSP